MKPKRNHLPNEPLTLVRGVSDKSCIAYSTMKTEYVAVCEVTIEVVWLEKLLMDHGIMGIE